MPGLCFGQEIKSTPEVSPGGPETIAKYLQGCHSPQLVTTKLLIGSLQKTLPGSRKIHSTLTIFQ